MRARDRIPRLAALTMVRDEAVMLPRWIAHYSKQCGDPQNLLVIDDNSRDGSTDDLPCPVIKIPPGTMRGRFERHRMRMVSGIAAGLLAVYDAVVFSDADEFLVADPAKYATLRDFLYDRPRRKAFGGMALNLVHHVPTEGGLDPQRPLLQQRSLAKFVPWMCKPALKRTTAPWTHASHGLVEQRFWIERDLYLFHAKFADVDLLRSTADRRQEVVDTLQRAPHSTWRHGGDQLVTLVEELTAGVDIDEVPEFTPRRKQLARVVQSEGSEFRTSGPAQMRVMQNGPFVRIPERFRDSV